MRRFTQQMIVEVAKRKTPLTRNEGFEVVVSIVAFCRDIQELNLVENFVNVAGGDSIFVFLIVGDRRWYFGVPRKDQELVSELHCAQLPFVDVRKQLISILIMHSLRCCRDGIRTKAAVLKRGHKVTRVKIHRPHSNRRLPNCYFAVCRLRIVQLGRQKRDRMS